MFRPNSALLLVLLALSCFHPTFSYKSFQALIPNGDKVTSPCKLSELWPGVGHLNQLGGGAKNNFGKAFFAAGKKWTKELCGADTDGDGVSNGEELGDPQCTWKPGDTPSRTTKISHPGFCDPFSSPSCMKKNEGLKCDAGKLDCPLLEGPEVMNKTFSFAKTKVPNKETTYICQAFDSGFEAHTDEIHMIASIPHIDNVEVMHHVLVFGCPEKPSNAEHFTKPYECGMGGTGCYKIIDLWSVGSPGNCLDEKMGIKMNKEGGYKWFVMQFHWNNPEKRNDYYDASGMTMFFEKKQRPNHGGVFMVGQQYLNLPPKMKNITTGTTCTKHCTNAIMTPPKANMFAADPPKRPLFIVSAVLHMHYAGIGGSLYLIRDGKVHTELVPEGSYRYDNPSMVEFKTPIEWKAGDSLKLSCSFNTEKNSEAVYYGDATADEMCYAFLMFYPDDSWKSFCIAYGDIDCESFYYFPNIFTGYQNLTYLGPKYDYVIGNVSNNFECNLGNFLINYHSKWAKNIRAECVKLAVDCKPQCKRQLEAMIAEEPCLRGWGKIFLDRAAIGRAMGVQNEAVKETLMDLKTRMVACNMPTVIPGMKENSGSDKKPMPKPKPEPEPEPLGEPVPMPLFIGVLVGCGVVIIVLTLLIIRLFITRNQNGGGGGRKGDYEVGGAGTHATTDLTYENNGFSKK